ncbi:MAG: ATP-binding cassette domain-containing protein [Thermoproteota archaeon]|nr:ATP-binding cassette domain-containing protein [Nitrosopumilus sp.]MDQ3083991.1 ATP-binding cassette domain-containing protein [Thermoproteota archaeon]
MSRIKDGNYNTKNFNISTDSHYSNENVVSVKGLRKSFKKLTVLDGIDFDIKKGTILALLGPNGAGKTTTIHILSTLLLPDKGIARISGFDVVKEVDKVRSLIGLTGQYAALDEYLTGRENLQMIGRLYRLSHQDIKQRTEELLELFDLVDAADRAVKTYSGGMRRRLDLAVSLIASPPIIFLDEPTSGLDPRSRLIMWDTIKQLAGSGTTILLTTQDMDEADHLASRIVVLDGGKIIAEGTSDELKQQVGSERLEITFMNTSYFEKAKEVIQVEKFHADSKMRTISFVTTGGVHQLRQVLSRLDEANIEVESISFHSPTLDDVFLILTGHSTEQSNREEREKEVFKQ